MRNCEKITRMEAFARHCARRWKREGPNSSKNRNNIFTACTCPFAKERPILCKRQTSEEWGRGEVTLKISSHDSRCPATSMLSGVHKVAFLKSISTFSLEEELSASGPHEQSVISTLRGRLVQYQSNHPSRKEEQLSCWAETAPRKKWRVENEPPATESLQSQFDSRVQAPSPQSRSFNQAQWTTSRITWKYWPHTFLPLGSRQPHPLYTRMSAPTLFTLLYFHSSRRLSHL